MLHAQTSAKEKRRTLRQALASGTLLRVPGAFSPLVAMQIEQLGFEAVYISGAVLSADLGLPDIGLTTLPEVAARGGQIARMTNLPCIIDVDTGFGEPMNAARTVQIIEAAGISACHIEDQINPKRCGHLDGKQVVESRVMQQRIRAAADARQDTDFMIIARTDARAIEGLDAAIDRAKAYVQAGAEMIFPEAMRDLSEFAAMRAALDVPILANMTEFGKSELFTTQQLQEVGVNMVIYPVTTLRIAMGAVRTGLQTLHKTGTQASLVPQMQTRAELYDLLDYAAYNQFDDRIFNFKLEEPA